MKCLLINLMKVKFTDENSGRVIEGYKLIYCTPIDEKTTQNKIGYELISCFINSDTDDFNFLNNLYITNHSIDFPIELSFDWLTYVKDMKPVNRPSNFKFIKSLVSKVV